MVVVIAGLSERTTFCKELICTSIHAGMVEAHLRNLGVTRQQPPVYIRTVSDVGVVALRCCRLEHLLNQSLRLIRLL